jgi:Domain of unknown function (DU1801)
MTSKATSPEQYLAELPDDRREAVSKIRQILLENLPEGFEEQMTYGMLGYVVPHSIYPKGYHTTPHLPLPFISLASQKNAITLYHMGLYGDSQLLEWFQTEYPKHCPTKLDMGKCCIHFKKIVHIPYDLIGDLATKVTVSDWIKQYEAARTAKN